MMVVKGIGRGIKRWWNIARLPLSDTAVRRSSSSSSVDSTSSTAEQRLAQFERETEQDAFLHMLSTPLRRCTVTGLVLPKALMFSLVPFKTEGEKYSSPPSVQKMLVEQEQLLRRSRVLVAPRHLHRWTRRKARPTLLTQLQRAQRMAKHKSVTAQTIESKDRFTAQLAMLNKQLGDLQRPLPQGKRLVVALQEHRRVTEERKDENGATMVRAGKASWCLLSLEAAQTLVQNRKKDLRFSRDTDGILNEVRRQLVLQVVLEARKILANVTYASYDSILRRNLLVREIEEDEIDAYIRSGANMEANAAVLLCMGKPPSLKFSKDVSHPWVYAVDKSLWDEETFDAVIDAMRKIAEKMSEKVRRAKRRKAREAIAAGEHRVLTHDEATNVESKSETPLFVVGRDYLTVDLTIALWRLRAWDTKGLSMFVDARDTSVEVGTD